VVLAFFSISAMQVAIALLLAAWVVGLLRGTRQPVESSLLLPGGLWAAAGLVSILLARDRGAAWGELGSLWLLLLAVPLAEALASRWALERGRRAWTVAAVVAALVGLAQVAVGGAEVRATGTVGHYMTYAGVMLLASQLLLGRVLFGPARGRLLGAVALALVLAALLATQTRSAWVGLVVGSTVQLIWRAPRLLLLVPVLGAVAYLAAPAEIQERIRSFADPSDVTANERVYMWRAGLAMAADHPIAGVGPDNVLELYPEYRLPEDPWLPWRRLTHLHSNPVQVVAERGLLGLSAFLFVAAFGVWSAFSALRRLRGEDRSGASLRALAAASLGGQLAFHGAGFFEYSFGDDEVMTLYLLMLALPFAVRAAQREPAREEGPSTLRWRPLLVGAVAVLAFGELWARSQTRTDADGNQRIGRRWMRPQQLPVAELRSELEQLSDEDYLQQDPELGWRIRPGARSADGLAHADERGLRITPGSSEEAELHILCLGDERTHGVGVTDGETWPSLLAVELERAGRPARISNLAVPGYSSAQVLLDWRRRGELFEDVDLVLVGTSGERNERDGNLLPVLLESGERGPFARPRFLLAGGGLEVAGRPVPAPEELLGLLAGGLAGTALAEHELFLHPENQRTPPLPASRILAYLDARIAPLTVTPVERFYVGPEGTLCHKLLRTLVREVRGDGGTTEARVVLLPSTAKQRGGQPGRQPGAEVVQELYAERLEQDGALRLLRPPVHPDGEGHDAAANAALASFLAREITGS